MSKWEHVEEWYELQMGRFTVAAEPEPEGGFRASLLVWSPYQWVSRTDLDIEIDLGKVASLEEAEAAGRSKADEVLREEREREARLERMLEEWAQRERERQEAV